jgi:hypothetical protein
MCSWGSWDPRSVCSEIGPPVVPLSGAGLSDFPKPTRLSLKAGFVGVGPTSLATALVGQHYHQPPLWACISRLLSLLTLHLVWARRPSTDRVADGPRGSKVRRYTPSPRAPRPSTLRRPTSLSNASNPFGHLAPRRERPVDDGARVRGLSGTCPLLPVSARRRRRVCRHHCRTTPARSRVGRGGLGRRCW